jgi:ankyrin repeat protein
MDESCHKNDNLLIYASLGNVLELENLLIHHYDFGTLLTAYKLTYIRGIKLQPNDDIRVNIEDKIKNIRLLRIENIKKIKNYIDEPLITVGENLLTCATLIYHKLEPFLTNDNITLFAMLLCRLDYNIFENFYDIYQNIDLYKYNKKGKNILHIACKYGNIDIVKLILKNNPEIDMQTLHNNQPHQTALHIAVEYHHVVIIELLLQHYASINILDHNKRSPLHYVCPGKYGNKQVFELLIKYGGNIDIKYKGKTFLYQAVCDNHVETVQYLLSLDASPYIPSIKLIDHEAFGCCYETPYELAKSQQFKKMEDKIVNYKIISLLKQKYYSNVSQSNHFIC